MHVIVNVYTVVVLVVVVCILLKIVISFYQEDITYKFNILRFCQ